MKKTTLSVTVPVLLVAATMLVANALVTPDERETRASASLTRSSGRAPGAADVIEVAPPDPTAQATPTVPPAKPTVAPAALRRFDNCGALRTYLREAATKVGHGAVYSVRSAMPNSGAATAGGPAQEDAAAMEPQSPKSTPIADSGSSHSETNVQEAGVDEPDFVKNDASRIVVVQGRELRTFRIVDGKAQAAGRLQLPEGVEGGELMLDGDRALVLLRSYPNVAFPQAQHDATGRIAIQPYAPREPRTLLMTVDLRDLSAPKELSRMDVEGSYTAARRIGHTARIVVQTAMQPKVDVAYATDPAPSARQEAEAINKRAIQKISLEQWLPTVRFGGKEKPLVSCAAASHPAEFSGLGLTAVLTVDLTKPLAPGSPPSVVANADHVYASSRSLYVATTEWKPATPEAGVPSASTAVHKFDLAAPGEARYAASGAVAGAVLNQFSMSEHAGNLRIATTTTTPATTPATSESQVVVLAERDGALQPIGSVGGLGKTERIYSVRFLGDTGYVVTFRQTDPLYTIDLSNPAAPKVLGELKINGFSSYLHPLPNDLLLGVGQDATEEGRRLGSQVSVFDVSNLATPSRVGQATVGNGSGSPVEHDHHAFLWWEARRLAVIPLHVWDFDRESGQDRGFHGAVAFRIGDKGEVQEAGRVQHPEVQQRVPEGAPPDYQPPRQRPPISRSIVVGDSLLTVSTSGILSSDLGTLQDRGWTPFDPPAS